MAEVSYTEPYAGKNFIGGAFWTGLSEGDTAAPYAPSGMVPPGHRSDRTVQVVGSFGGGEVVIEGSLSEDEPGASDWSPVHDPQGNELSFTQGGVGLVVEHVRWLRPRVATGTGVDVTVRLMES